jgi:hypothetical protein
VQPSRDFFSGEEMTKIGDFLNNIVDKRTAIGLTRLALQRLPPEDIGKHLSLFDKLTGGDDLTWREVHAFTKGLLISVTPQELMDLENEAIRVGVDAGWDGAKEMGRQQRVKDGQWVREKFRLIRVHSHTSRREIKALVQRCSELLQEKWLRDLKDRKARAENIAKIDLTKFDQLVPKAPLFPSGKKKGQINCRKFERETLKDEFPHGMAGRRFTGDGKYAAKLLRQKRK